LCVDGEAVPGTLVSGSKEDRVSVIATLG
jgi:hypothetical protein